MGFSVSGSAAIIFIAAFVGFGILYTSAYNSFELVEEARSDNADALVEQENTAIAIMAISNTQTTVNVTVRNTGSNQLEVENTDIMINGTPKTHNQVWVEGSSQTQYWPPGKNLSVEVEENVNYPYRVKVVTGPGIAAAETKRK